MEELPAIKKEVCRWNWEDSKTHEQCESNRVSIRAAHCYSSDFAWIEYLVSVAMKDFPSLKKSDIQVVKYGGSFIKGYSGIEFNPGKMKIPLGSGYEIVSLQHPTL